MVMASTVSIFAKWLYVCRWLQIFLRGGGGVCCFIGCFVVVTVNVHLCKLTDVMNDIDLELLQMSYEIMMYLFYDQNQREIYFTQLWKHCVCHFHLLFAVCVAPSVCLSVSRPDPYGVLQRQTNCRTCSFVRLFQHRVVSGEVLDLMTRGSTDTGMWWHGDLLTWGCNDTVIDWQGRGSTDKGM